LVQELEEQLRLSEPATVGRPTGSRTSN
jgi:hypothetical protein